MYRTDRDAQGRIMLALLCAPHAGVTRAALQETTRLDGALLRRTMRDLLSRKLITEDRAEDEDGKTVRRFLLKDEQLRRAVEMIPMPGESEVHHGLVILHPKVLRDMDVDVDAGLKRCRAAGMRIHVQAFMRIGVRPWE